MKINQVEELVGITKKNIRFYEEEGLLNPERNPENGYREYGLSDVKTLRKIKLLRKLDIPLEKIRELQKGNLTVHECMEEQVIRLEHEKRDIGVMQALCERLETEAKDYDSLDAQSGLEEMLKLEKGGAVFMDVSEKDIKKKSKRGAILAAVIFAAWFLFMIGAVLLASRNDAIPWWGLLLIIVGLTTPVAGVLAALTQRIKEIDKGEEYEARKY